MAVKKESGIGTAATLFEKAGPITLHAINAAVAKLTVADERAVDTVRAVDDSIAEITIL